MSSGQWEVVGKSKKSQNGKVKTKEDEKKAVKNGPKLEDVVPHSQIKSFYSGMEIDDERKSTKDQKKGGDKKKKQDKKNVEPPKPKPPKTLEGAFEIIDVAELANIITTNKLRFSNAPLVWLKEVATFLNSKTQIEVEDPTFSNYDPLYPLSTLPQDIRSSLASVLHDAGKANAQLFFDVTLTALSNDMSRGQSVNGHRLLLQMLAQDYPEFCVTSIQKSASLRNSYQNRPPIGLSLLWAFGQGGISDFAVGLKAWQDLFLPIIELKNYTKYVIVYLSTLLDTHAKMDSTKVSQDQLFAMIDMVNNKRNSLPKDQSSDLIKQLSKYKDIYFNRSNNKLQVTFNQLMKKLPNQYLSGSTLDPYHRVLVDCLVDCLVRDDSCNATWRQLFHRCSKQSATLLDYIDSNWANVSLKIKKKSLKSTVLQYKEVCGEALKGKKKDETVVKTNKICQPWRPETLAVDDSIDVVDEPRIRPRRLFEPNTQNNDDDNIFDYSLAEALAVDSGSEEDEDEYEEPTWDQLLAILSEAADAAEPELDTHDLDMGEFIWSADYSTYTGSRETFVEETGPKIDDMNASDIFEKIWDQPLLQMIVAETNLYAWQTIVPLSVSETGISAQSRLNDWVETSVSEIYRLLSIMILMGICVRGQINEYWEAGIMGMPSFREIMSKNRFILLMRFLQFTDNYNIIERGNEKKIVKILPILNYLNIKFKAVYSPRRELSIDESLLLWKGRLSWIQCIRTKAARFGIKSYELCEAVSGYVLEIVLYTGKGTSSSQPVGGFTNSTSKIVINLLTNYLDKGYTVYMDNFYNSVALCRFLKRRATDVVGTLNRRRQNTPNDIKNLDERRMSPGAVVGRHCGDVSVTSWKDVKLVTTVSTYHNSDVCEGRRAGQAILKPIVVSDYNKSMGGVDLKDQKLSSYLLERKRGMKWYIKVFRRLLNISILNSYIIHKQNTQNQLTHRQFRYALAQQLIHKYGTTSVPRSQPQPVSNARLDKRLNHNPDQNVVDGERTSSSQNKFKRGRCVRCLAAKKRTMSSVMCRHCKVFLCLGQCYDDYHNLEAL